jgi:hypothetical protein
MTSTEAKWQARVEAWKRSGLSAPAFCKDKDYRDGGLRYWASRLRREGFTEEKPVMRLARVVTTSDLRTETPIVVEVGSIRIGVRRGFDPEALRAVLDVVGEREATR